MIKQRLCTIMLLQIMLYVFGWDTEQHCLMVGAMMTMNEDFRLLDICHLSYLACVKDNRIMMHRWLGQVWQAEKIWG